MVVDHAQLLGFIGDFVALSKGLFVNFFSQCEQLYGFLLMCILSCITKALSCVNFLSQCSQLKVFLCNLSCFSRASELAKSSLHWEQLNGFALWIVSCSLRLAKFANLLSHCRQLKGFSPVWILSWSVSNSELWNSSSQFEHLNGNPGVCILSCSCSRSAFANFSSQSEHLNSFWAASIERVKSLIKCNFKWLINELS